MPMSDPVAVSLVRGSSCAGAPGRAPAGGEPWNRLRCVPSRCPGQEPGGGTAPGQVRRPHAARRRGRRLTTLLFGLFVGTVLVLRASGSAPRRHGDRHEQTGRTATAGGQGGRAAPGPGPPAGRGAHRALGRPRRPPRRPPPGRDRDARAGGRGRGEGGRPARRRPCPRPGLHGGPRPRRRTPRVRRDPDRLGGRPRAGGRPTPAPAREVTLDGPSPQRWLSAVDRDPGRRHLTVRPGHTTTRKWLVSRRCRPAHERPGRPARPAP